MYEAAGMGWDTHPAGSMLSWAPVVSAGSAGLSSAGSAKWLSEPALTAGAWYLFARNVAQEEQGS